MLVSCTQLPHSFALARGDACCVASGYERFPPAAEERRRRPVLEQSASALPATGENETRCSRSDRQGSCLSVVSGNQNRDFCLDVWRVRYMLTRVPFWCCTFVRRRLTGVGKPAVRLRGMADPSVGSATINQSVCFNYGR